MSMNSFNAFPSTVVEQDGNIVPSYAPGNGNEHRYGKLKPVGPDDMPHELGSYDPQSEGAESLRGDEHIPGRDPNWRLTPAERAAGKRALEASRAARGE